MKTDLLRARNMKRYINQLTVAKKQCEKRIRVLGGPAYDQQEDGVLDEGEGPQSQKVEPAARCLLETLTLFISLVTGSSLVLFFTQLLLNLVYDPCCHV